MKSQRLKRFWGKGYKYFPNNSHPTAMKLRDVQKARRY